jgi:hypothetical protein
MAGTMIRLLGILIIAAAAALEGQTVISGDLSRFALDSANNPFVVDTSVEVPANKNVIIGEGCVFLFLPFTGLNIYGSLTVNGTQAHPVIFTTINDSLYNRQSKQIPNPFDWNGLFISSTSVSSVLKNFTLTYSTYGIKSQRDDIAIADAAFKYNGQFHFTINDKIQYVQDNFPFSYSKPQPAPQAAPADTLSPPPAPAGDSHYRTVRWIRRIGFGVLAAGGGGAGVVFNKKSNSRYDEYRANTGLASGTHDAAWNSVKNDEKTRNIFYAAAGVFAAAFAVSIPF